MGWAETIRIILPSGMRNAMVTDAGGIVRISTEDYYLGDTYRAVVRAYAKKMPGFIFSDF